MSLKSRIGHWIAVRTAKREAQKAASGPAHQRRVFDQLVQRGAGTQFGRDHGLRQGSPVVRGVQEFHHGRETEHRAVHALPRQGARAPAEGVELGERAGAGL